MPEQEQQNPFEDHINSDAFDVERLDKAFPQTEMDLEIERFFDELPYPLNHELWDTELDEQQKVICAHLATELIDRVLRVNHQETLEHLNDAELLELLTAPITIAMLAQQRLYHSEPKEVKAQILIPPPLEKAPTKPVPTLIEQLKGLLNQLQDFVIRIFRRR
jgi:hypothetical protein